MPKLKGDLKLAKLTGQGGLPEHEITMHVVYMLNLKSYNDYLPLTTLSSYKRLATYKKTSKKGTWFLRSFHLILLPASFNILVLIHNGGVLPCKVCDKKNQHVFFLKEAD